jgi:integrase
MLFRQTYKDPKTGSRRQSKYWSYEFTFAGTRIRESANTKSKTAAKAAEEERRRRLQEGAAGLRRRKPQLLRTAAEEWLTLKGSSLAPSSLRIEKTSLRHLLPVMGAVLTSDIEASDVAAYQKSRSKEGASNGTINLEVATLRAILRRSGLWARIQPDTRMLPERNDAGRALTTAEEARLLSAASESRSRSLWPALILALNTGLRRGELASIRWNQVDLESRRITVGRSKTEAGAGRKVPLNDASLAALSTLAKRFPFRRPDHFVFPSEKYGQGGSAYDVNPDESIGTFKEGWRAAKMRAGVSCRWHDLRHTFCTRLLERGQGLPILAALMGWSAATTIRMAKLYGHISADVLNAAVASLNGPNTAGG